MSRAWLLRNWSTTGWRIFLFHGNGKMPSRPPIRRLHDVLPAKCTAWATISWCSTRATAPFRMNPAQAKAIADRHFGVGCDTVVVIRPGGAQADATLAASSMPMAAKWNPAATPRRCVARLLMDERGLARVKLATKGGMLVCSDAGKGLVTVDMGDPELDWNEIPLARRPWTPANFPLDIGRRAAFRSARSRWAIPIASCSWPTPKRRRWPSWVPGSKPMPFFPNRTNVEFAQVHGPRPHPHAGVGARHGRDPGLRHRRLRHRRGGHPARACGPQGRIWCWTAARS